ncbi:aminotransferase class I/II-fold pyridoxal phosphate-dependent enzyme [Nocardioides sp.]|uniref:aminotransferase class I/II-fold pyridoxal phosphate-dependent enzyme n=1 Tax=Nocardioides sp. TaxID=35761 RepID=UPI003515AA45
MWTTAQRRRLTETPYADALERHASAGIANFHALPIGSLAHAPDPEDSRHARQTLRLFGTELLATQMTLGSPELDSFFRAHRTLARTRRLTAEAFGADETHYVTTGTTGANQIALEALRVQGARVLVDRSTHQSVHYALDRLGAEVTHAATAPDDAEHGVITALRRAAAEGAPFDVVVIGVSAYDGALVQMRRFLAALHELTATAGCRVLVDEAWTAIHAFHPVLRRNAAVPCIREALDDHPDWPASFLVTQSAHKSMLALRQGSYLHVVGPESLRADVHAAVYRVHTTSPSLPIVASLDVARAHAVAEGERLVDRALILADRIRDLGHATPGLAVHEPLRGGGGAYQVDPMKVHLHLGSPERAHEVRRELFDEYGVFVSRQDGPTLLFTVHVGVTPEQVDVLAEGLQAVCGGSAAPESVLGGRYVIAYPPGIPLQVPGEHLAALPERRAGEELYSTF